MQSVPCHAGYEVQYSVCGTCLENDATQCGYKIHYSLQGSHKLWKSWKTWKITKKFYALKNHGIRKNLNNHEKSLNFVK